MTALADWMHPPRAEGWFAEDLDHLPGAPRHTELIDGALVFVMSPQRAWHSRLVSTLRQTLAAQAPEGFEVDQEMTIRLEAVSPESAHRDRTVKLRKYAEAGIPHYWRIEDESGSPAVHAYELDEPTRAYVAAGIHRGVLRRPVPFDIDISLSSLIPQR